jgi:Ca2+-binding RTX toxin-like protein
MSGYGRLEGGRGGDRIYGGAGRDGIYARDGERDWIVCGSASDRGERDRVWADRLDFVSLDCEIVYRLHR